MEVMKQIILEKKAEDFIKQLALHKFLCAAAAVLAIMGNVILTACRNDQNHIALLIANILLDVAAGWFIITWLNLVILPQGRLVKLYRQPREEYVGTVQLISEQVQRIRFLDCIQVTVGEDARIFFMPVGMLQLCPGRKYILMAVSNVIVEATEHEE